MYMLVYVRTSAYLTCVKNTLKSWEIDLSNCFSATKNRKRKKEERKGKRGNGGGGNESRKQRLSRTQMKRRNVK